MYILDFTYISLATNFFTSLLFLNFLAASAEKKDGHRPEE